MKGGAAAQELFWKSDEEGIVEGRAYEQVCIRGADGLLLYKCYR